MLAIVWGGGGGFESAKWDAACRHEHRFRRKLGVTQGLLLCLLQASLPKRWGWKAFPGSMLPLSTVSSGN